MAATLRTPNAGHLLSLLDEARGDSFLMDTGATYSVVPHHSEEHPRGLRIVTDDRARIIALARSQRQDQGALAGYKKLLGRNGKLPPVKHDVEHTIDTGDSHPIAQ